MSDQAPASDVNMANAARPLPPTITNPAMLVNKRGKVTTSRRNTVTKRTLCNAAYAAAVDEINPAMRYHQLTAMDKCWRQVCFHRFCARDMNSPMTANIIQQSVRDWVIAMDKIYFVAPEDHIRRGRPAGVALAMAAAAAATVATAPAPAPQPQPPMMLRFEAMHPVGLAALLMEMTPESINEVMQDMPPNLVEHIFSIMGLSNVAAGDRCPMCEELRRDWSKITRTCEHRMCADCAVKWAKNCASQDGQGCPACMRSGVDKMQCLADPRSMFPASLLRNNLSVVPFVSFQIPLLQSVLDAKMAQFCSSSSSSSGETKPAVCRCPDCATVSVSGNNLMRRCHNPQCAVEFCLLCTCAVGATEPYERHVRKECIAAAQEAERISAGEGLTACPNCQTRVWHAVYHGCHAVKCPGCSLVFCHACQTPYVKGKDHVAACKCPIFCCANHACRCAKTCPECDIAKCEHCDGGCDSCMARIMRERSLK